MNQFTVAVSVLFFGVCAFAAQAQNIISLSQALEMALDSAPELKQAQAVASAQREKARGSWTNVGPKVSVEYNQVYFKDKLFIPFNGNNILLRNDLSKTGSLMVVQPLTSSFALVELAQVEELRAELKDKGLTISKRDLSFSVAELYLQAQQSQMLLELARMAITAVQSQANDAEAMSRVGRLNRGDLLKLKLAVSEAQANEAKALAGKEIAFSTLAETIGLGNQATLSISLFNPDAIDLSKPIPTIDQALKEALNRNAELAQAEIGKNMASFGRNVAYSKFIPTVNIFAKLDRNFGEISFGSQKNTQSYGVQVKWELWNNGTDVYAIREVSKQMQEADALRSLAEKGLRIALHRTLALLKASEHSLALAKTAVEQAEESLRIENAKFKAGNSTATELVFAETARSSARGRVVASHTEFKIYQLALQKILGDEQPSLGEFKK